MVCFSLPSLPQVPVLKSHRHWVVKPGFWQPLSYSLRPLPRWQVVSEFTGMPWVLAAFVLQTIPWEQALSRDLTTWYRVLPHSPSRPSSLSQVSEKNEALLLNIPTLATGGEVRNRVSWHPESQADPSAEQSPGQSLSTRLPELWTQPDKTPLGDLWGNLYLRYMFWHSWERDGTAQVKTQSSPQCLAFRRCVTVQVRLSLLHQGGETWANGLGDLWAWGHPFPY